MLEIGVAVLVHEPGKKITLQKYPPVTKLSSIASSHVNQLDYDQGTHYAGSIVPLPGTVLVLLSAELPMQQSKLHKHAAKSPWLSGFVAAN